MKEKIELSKDGRMKFTHTSKAPSTQVVKKVGTAQAPFTKLVDEIMASISKFFEENKDTKGLSGKELSILVVGALAFVTGHYFVFLKRNTRDRLDKHEFAKEFADQICAAVDTVGEGNPF